MSYLKQWREGIFNPFSLQFPMKVEYPKLIENGNYGTKEEMLIKLDVFLLNNRITQDEYTELVNLLEVKEAEKAGA